MKTVITFGAFDLVHKGHIHYLSQAKKYWTKLVTIVARDATIQKIKGKKPKFDENKRLKDILDLKISDIVELWDSKDFMYWIKKYKPDVVAIWYDQNSFIHQLSEYLNKNKLKTAVVHIDPYKPEIYKSSKLKQ